MISDLDLKIYKALLPQKTPSERYLGKVEFFWEYSIVHYTAECLEGIPFNLFDKAITGLLQVDNKALSLEEIGKILGLNVVQNSSPQQYRDEAEYALLQQALDELHESEMVEFEYVGYEGCYLTRFGKTCIQQGLKFKSTEQRAFALYYDHTGQQHPQAKQMLVGLKANEQKPLIENACFLDEATIQEVALQQAPDIYNPDRGCFFKNPTINLHQSKSCKLKLFVGLLLDINTQEIRLQAYVPQNDAIDEPLSNWLNAHHKNEIIERFLAAEWHHSRNSNLLPTIDQSNAKNLIDIVHFWHHLPSFITPDTKEMWFFLPQYSPPMLKQIEQLKADGVSVFVALPYRYQAQPVLEKQALIEKSQHLENLLFVDTQTPIEELKIISVAKRIQSISPATLNAGCHQLPYTCYKTEVLKRLPSVCKQLKQNIAPVYLDLVEQQIKHNPISKSTTQRKTLESLDKKAQVFVDLQEHEDILHQIFRIEQAKQALIARFETSISR